MENSDEIKSYAINITDKYFTIITLNYFTED